MNIGAWLSVPFSAVQSLSPVRLFVTPWISACQASLSITNSQSLLKLRPIQSVMPSNHLICCHPLLLLPPIPLSIRVFSNESTLRMRWPKYSTVNVSLLCLSHVGILLLVLFYFSINNKHEVRVIAYHLKYITDTFIGACREGNGICPS